jgi:hypothetical protein
MHSPFHWTMTATHAAGAADCCPWLAQLLLLLLLLLFAITSGLHNQNLQRF